MRKRIFSKTNFSVRRPVPVGYLCDPQSKQVVTYMAKKPLASMQTETSEF